ncbi:hypothetical protein G4O51_02955 [Candidatus Bathyarchaeota archaeon A05DMB-2]|nr:hypothetical protein [Candidatus Bathyarchaeota archaeon A05DMB-2]
MLTVSPLLMIKLALDQSTPKPSVQKIMKSLLKRKKLNSKVEASKRSYTHRP